MLNRLQNRWAGFTPGDRIVLLLVEVAVIAICVSLLVTSSPMGNDGQAVTAVVGFLFIGLQVVVLLIVLSFAASRRRKAATAAPTKSAKEKGGQLWIRTAVLACTRTSVCGRRLHGGVDVSRK